jgi:hypothetical protein
MKNTARKQSGVTLVVALVMLVMITVFAVAMVRLSNTSMQVVGNMQMQRSLEADAQSAVEEKISSPVMFYDAIDNKGQFLTNNYVDVEAPKTRTVVRITKPVCVGKQDAYGYTLGSALTPQDNVFEIKATATNAMSGASVELVQGVKIRMAAGTCL